MSKRFFILCLLILAACRPQPPQTDVLTPIPFPTMTIGRSVSGVLPFVTPVPQGAALANPATVAALSNQTTPTPNYAACPSTNDAELDDSQITGTELIPEMERFLSSGGRIEILINALETWGLFDEETGFTRTNLDFTGEGTTDILLGYFTPGQGGTLAVFGCINGRYVNLYRFNSEQPAPPTLLFAGDINFDQRPDLVFATEQCEAEDTCEFFTQIVTWQPEEGRFVSLLQSPIASFNLPSLTDIDDDEVAEVVVTLDNRGTSTTGPLPTGLNIYDWNGTIYTLSIVQYDPPRYRIQLVHEADRAFNRLDMNEAAILYETALADADLRYWFNDGPVTLTSYVYYRLLLLYSFLQDARTISTFQRIQESYPERDNAPIYAQLAYTYWEVLEITNNPHSACLEVLEMIEQEPQALSLINRYGSRNPTYTAEDLCPL